MSPIVAPKLQQSSNLALLGKLSDASLNLVDHMLYRNRLSEILASSLIEKDLVFDGRRPEVR